MVKVEERKVGDKEVVVMIELVAMEVMVGLR